MQWLRRLLKIVALGIASLVLGSLLAFAYYDLTVFQPRRGEINAMLRLAHPSERDPPAALRELLRAQIRGREASQASRLLLSKLEGYPAHDGMLGWHGRAWLWWRLVQLHLSERDQLAVILSQSFLGRRAYGFAAGAQRWFGKPLADLAEPELATLVILMWWPSRFGAPENFDQLHAARDGLLERVSRMRSRDEKRAAHAARP